MSLEQVISGWAKSHPMVIDATAAGLVLFLVTADVANGGFEASQRPPDVLAYVLLVGQILPFVFRRRYPFAVMYVMVASLGLYWILGYPAGSDASGLVAIYSGVAYGKNRPRTWAHAGVGIVAMTMTASLLAADFFIDEEGFTPLVVVAVAALHIAAAIFGEVVYQRRQRGMRLEAQAALAEAEGETRARLAVVEERTRIAREMHDVVAHGMSVISVQASAAQEIARSDPDRTIDILGDIEATGREALTEMRRMLGVLRSSDDHAGALSPQPSLVDLNSAIAHCVEAGLPTELVITGDEQRLAPGLELAAFRITQEALTNILKHAGNSAVATVAVDYRAAELELTITDTGRGAVSNLTSTGGGNGLMGMRERVDAYNGLFTHGPNPGGGYQVRVVFLLDEDATRPGVTSAEAPTREQLT
jgi:signal transduction histidine kinase